MNIIKFKDQIRPCDDLFNTYLKGKYAYWIRMRYVVPFEFISDADYVSMEGDIDMLLNSDVKYWDINKGDIQMYVNSELTDSANNIIPFVRSNSFSTDSELTLDEVKKFRRWLAETLLSFDRNMGGQQKNQLYTESFTKVLEYYANDMYNDVVKALSEINPEFNIANPKFSNCGCGAGADLSSLYGNGAAFCNPVELYRKHIYNEMVKKFSDIDFWQGYSDEFLIEFKAYIDNIISLNLPLRSSIYVSNFQDCSCTGQDKPQTEYIDILKRLSKALQYIFDGDMKGHINYVTSAFIDWSIQLYEHMQWD